ncbi:hypothetical protein TorRG33x02_325530, partial [Trema orientale]
MVVLPLTLYSSLFVAQNENPKSLPPSSILTPPVLLRATTPRWSHPQKSTVPSNKQANNSKPNATQLYKWD